MIEQPHVVDHIERTERLQVARLQVELQNAALAMPSCRLMKRSRCRCSRRTSTATTEAVRRASGIVRPPRQAERDGTIGQLLVKPGSQVEPSDLLLTLE